MTDDFYESEEGKNVLKVLTNAMNYVANEAVVLLQYQTIFEEKFSELGLISPGDDHFEKRMDHVAEHLGGPPEAYLLRTGQKAPPADRYPEAILHEVIAVYQLAQKSVIRAHMFQSGVALLNNPDDPLHENPELNTHLIKQAQSAFWEHAEAAYIRLHSFWDRLGQVLDFAFFNIRKFDQNGFTAVMDRIHNNVVPMNERLQKSGSWKRLRTFQSSEKEDGLKWLLQRRNLIVHSLHLHPVREEDEGVFVSQFNHLETAHREKLRPRPPEEEVELLLEQLKQATVLFHTVLDVVENSQSRKKDPRL